jgi:hypothetical protein
MLESLDSIPWEKLYHFRDYASNIPQAIRDLASQYRMVRQDGIRTIYNDLWHQETVCDTTALAVPFLIELLSETAVEDKSDVVKFLTVISSECPFDGSDPAAVFFQSSSDEYVLSPWWYPPDPASYNLVRSAVQKGCSVYQQLLLSQEPPHLRGTAAYLLGILTDCNNENINWLRSHLATEQDEQVRGVIVFSVGLCSDDLPENTAWLQHIFDTETSLFLQINAAIGLGRRIPQHAPELVIDLLIDSLVNPNDVASMFDRYPWTFKSCLDSGIMQYWCIIALNQIGIKSPRLLPTLINALDKVSSEGSYEIASCILNIIFDAKPIPRTIMVEQLSDKQRLGLEAIANCKQFWLEYSENCTLDSVASILQNFYLPSEPRRLKAFLAEKLTIGPSNEPEEIPF